MKHLLAVLSSLAVLAACSSSSDLEPRSGAWNYGGSAIVRNTCGNDTLPTDAAGGFTLTVTGDGTLTVDDGDFALPFDCTHDGDSFSCPNRGAGMYKIDNLDATVFYEVSVTGDFASDTELTGTQVIKLRCEGMSCAIAPDLKPYTLPCEYSYSFDATAQ